MTIVASAGLNGEIGRNGDLCWHIREDLKHFKELTLGGAVIMGRNTWESLPRKPLPGRLNIVVSKSMEPGEGFSLAKSPEEAIEMARSQNLKAFIIGGASLYAQTIGMADSLEITRIYAADPKADTFFPEIDMKEWKLTRESDLMTAPDGPEFRYLTYERSRNLP